MDKKLLVGIAAVILIGVLGAGYFFMKGNQVSQTSGTGSESSVAPQASSQSESGNPKTFTIDGSNYAFNPSQINVKQGDTVKIIFKDDDGRHNLIVDGYNVSTNIIQGGSEDSVQFVADKTGTFEYYCSVANHRALGMTGKLIVE